MKLLEPENRDAEKHHIDEEEVTIEDWEFDEARTLRATINGILRHDAARQ
jgi:hypothetical protein